MLLYSAGILSEYVEKLLEKNVKEEVVLEFVRVLMELGLHITLNYVHRRYYPRDPDDVEFLLTALEGGATHLVTYDKHLHEIAYRYKEDYLTCEPIKFLEELRKVEWMENLFLVHWYIPRYNS